MKRLASAMLVLIALAGRASAFPYGTQFDADPVNGVGGGGRIFVGATRDAGHTCAACHVDAPGRIEAHLEANPIDLFAGYRPGARYELRVVLRHEWAGLQWASNGNDCGDFDATPWPPCNDNGFAVEIDDGNGTPVGVFGSDGCGAPSAADADVRVLADGTGITHAGALHDRVSWAFCWTAPANQTGDLFLHLAMVDGSGGDGTMDNPNDPFGDDVFAATLSLPQQGAAHPPPGGCATVPGRPAWMGFALLFLPAMLGRRAVRRRMVATLVLLALVAGGCSTTRVRPWQKEKLAKRIMVLRPDTDEARLDLHMLESREGSVGGFGTSGGGCGCN